MSVFDPVVFDPVRFDTVITGRDSSDIDLALVELLQNDAGLAALMPTGTFVFMDEAPANLRQFVIVTLVDENDEAVFGGRAFEDALYLVKVVECSTVAAHHEKTVAARIDAVLEDGTLTVPGYTYMTMFRERRERHTEVDEADPSIRWFHRGGFYRVQMAVAT